MYTHRAQVTPVLNSDVPIVSTGAEYLVPQLSSKRFTHRAQQDGTVMEVEKNNYIKVKYKNNETKFFDISPRLSSTKRASYINLSMDTLEPGTKFKKNELVAWTKNFNGEAYCGGKNLTMALLNYNGTSFEDGYAITEDTSDNFQVEATEEINAMVPLNTKILTIFDKIGQETSNGETLLEFEYQDGDLEDYIEKFSLFGDEDFKNIEDTSDDLSESDENLVDPNQQSHLYNLDKNKIKIKSPGGELIQIKIFVNNIKSVDPSIVKLWKSIASDLKDRKKKYSQGATNEKDQLAAIDNLDMSQLKTGKHKFKGNLFEGARVVFYINRTKKLEKGDKLANRLIKPSLNLVNSGEVFYNANVQKDNPELSQVIGKCND